MRSFRRSGKGFFDLYHEDPPVGRYGVYLVLSGDDYNAFLSQAKQYRLGEKVQMLTEQVDEMVLDATGDASVGLIGGSRYPNTLDNPQNKEFVAAWKAEYGKVPWMFEGDQYQSCMVLQAGSRRRGVSRRRNCAPRLKVSGHQRQGPDHPARLRSSGGAARLHRQGRKGRRRQGVSDGDRQLYGRQGDPALQQDDLY